MRTAETVVTTGKMAIYLNHLKQNRIEYILLGLIAHSLGLLDKLAQQTAGVCF